MNVNDTDLSQLHFRISPICQSLLSNGDKKLLRKYKSLKHTCKYRVDQHLIVLNLYSISINKNLVSDFIYDWFKIVNTVNQQFSWRVLSKVIECLGKSNTRMNTKYWKTNRYKKPSLLKRGTTWNNLERARNDMKRPTVSKKRPEPTYNKQETTWNDLQRTDSNFMEPLYLIANQLEDSNVTKKR